MGSCIICGSSVDGRICELHEEDVVFEFTGTQASELTADRYYRGTVDGFAEFGVFVDIGDHVTGLLHKSELDQRLDSLDWDSGDAIFVQVQNVRDNGNVDLGWSIRQDESSFRGTLIDDPDADHAQLAEGAEGEAGNEDGGETTPSVSPSPAESERSEERDQSPTTTSADGSGETAEATADAAAETDQSAEPEPEPAPAEREYVDVPIDELDDAVGDFVRIEGEIVDAHQTSGPTVFQLRDETGSVECAAFEEAGVRAYPEVDEGDVVRLEGEVERRRGELQVETEGLVVLDEDEEAAFAERMEDAMVQRARPDAVQPLAETDAAAALSEDVRDAATAVRRAVLEGRPVVVRHSATVDGYVGSVAIERATLPLIREEHTGAEAEYHYFDRRPIEGSVYDMNDATKDVTMMLSNRERHDEALPLFVFVAAGGTVESLDAFDLLEVYDARTALIDAETVDEEIAASTDTLVTPPADAGETTNAAIGANVAAHVNETVRGDLEHLPAISFWEGTPEAYLDLAADAGYDADAVHDLREAIALEAHYQSYDDKRELIIDLLFAEEAEDQTGLARHVSEQYRERMDTEIETAEANLESREVDGETILVLDTAAFTHRYEFPPSALLLDELFRRHREDAVALVGVDEDEAFVRSAVDLDLRAVTERAREDAPEAGLDAGGAREGRIEFISGEREAVEAALVEAVAGELSSAAAA